MGLAVFLGTVLGLYGIYAIMYEMSGISRWRTCTNGCRHQRPARRSCDCYPDWRGGIPAAILEGHKTCHQFSPKTRCKPLIPVADADSSGSSL